MIGFDLNDVSSINFGSIGIDSVYVGNTKIWEDTPAHDYEQDYFTTVAKGSGNIRFIMSKYLDIGNFGYISYSTDGGNTWTTTNNVSNEEIIVTVPVNNGDKVLWKGSGVRLQNGRFDSDVNYDVEGNVMSLLNGDNFYHSSVPYSAAFSTLFTISANLISAENLILPATTLYSNYYQLMFQGCTSLTTAPELPATTLAQNCYKDMFHDCTSLTTAPALPATTLAIQCYDSMFRGCTSLNYIKMLATDISANYSLNIWVNGVSATGTFVKDANTEIPIGVNGIPDGWTVINQ